ncbi:MAG: DUF3999 family protein [Thermoguttaceae bacterium]
MNASAARAVSLCLLCIAFGRWEARGAAGPSAYRFCKEVHRTPAPNDEVVAVRLDSQVYAIIREGFPDLRIFDQQDAEVPFLLEKVAESRYPVAAFSVFHDPHQKRTVVRVFTRREPLTCLRLETSSRNFSRRAAVQVPRHRAGETNWADLASAALSKIDFQGLRHEELEIRFPESREPLYRIVIFNEDNPPLDITAVRAEGNAYRAVFLAQQERTYRLGYGSGEAQWPRYETAQVLPSIRAGARIVEARLGQQGANPEYSGEPGPGLHGILNHTAILVTAIFLMAAVLAWVLFRAGRRIDSIPKQ